MHENGQRIPNVYERLVGNEGSNAGMARILGIVIVFVVGLNTILWLIR